MIVASEISKRLLIWGVVAVSLLPRQHVDRNACAIGGKLSYPFKKLLFGILVVNLVRLLLKDSQIRLQFRVLADALGILQQFGHTFLCFLTPYILQTWLAPIINIGGRPGASLMTPLYVSTFLSVAAVILVRTVHPNFWCLRKLGNAVSCLPVLKTLQMFNVVTTRGGYHAGRGTIMSQSLMIVEYWFIISQILCAFGFALNPRSNQDEWGQLEHVMEAFRDFGFVSDWTRIFMHALFINQLDEFHLSFPSGGGREHAQNNRDSDTEAGIETQDLVRS